MCVMVVAEKGGWQGSPQSNCITQPMHYHQSACISLFVCLPINLSDCLSLGLIDPQPGRRDRRSALQKYRDV